MIKPSAANDAAHAAVVEQVLIDHAGREGALLPILHDIQAALGHVPESVIPAIAHGLNLSRAEVHGVISFYHDFHTAPRTRPVIKLCRAESCKARGVEALAERFAGENRVSIETVYCLGLCSVGPNAMVGEQLHARLDAARLTALVDTVACA
jgi:formate dehydrogenase subunit gamma